LEAVLAGAVARNARVVAGVGARRCVEYQRTDSVLVDHDLVQSVFEHLQTDSNDDAAKSLVRLVQNYHQVTLFKRAH